jgi:predicted GNAT family acetyltransferase
MSSEFVTSEVRLDVSDFPKGPNKRSAGLKVAALTPLEQEEILQFLSRRPIHTVCMASYVRDHGVVSPLNRGIFYGCRDSAGVLKGVALIGHATLFETQSNLALKAFAELSHQHATSHLIRAERGLIARFWKHYERLGHSPRLAYRESLLEKREAVPSHDKAPQLRLATLDDLTTISRVNAAMVFSECGIDPLKTDRTGFCDRIARRIQNNRVYVWQRGRRLIFKADIFAETPNMIYLEGVNVHPRERGKGYGLRCMAHLCSLLLRRSRAICLLVNEQKKSLRSFYRQVGFKARGSYDTVYLDAHVK